MDPVAQLNSTLATRYLIERELGRGGMATVYLARDLRHDRDVAIKVLHPDLGAALGADRFLAEIRTTARLQHPHVLPLLDSGDADGLLYYVMPSVAGETLRGRLERERRLPIDEAVRIAREVADALQYAHAAGIIHRDIKPENILLHGNPQGGEANPAGGGHALVADFGIALAVEQAGGQRMTQTGLSLGTPQYMSPEQSMGERTIDARSDIYSLGAVLYEMLAGEPPFTGPTAQAIVAQVITGEPRPIEARRRSVPPNVSAPLRTALDKLPADRFATAREFAAALATPGFRAAPGAPSGVHDLRRQRSTIVLGAIACAAIVAAAWGWLRRPGGLGVERETGTSSTWLATLAMPDSVTPVGPFSIAQDGSRLVFAAVSRGSRQIWVREADALDAHPVPGSDSARYPMLSPDARRIAYHGPGSLRVIGVAGGSPTIVSDSLGTSSLIEWADNDHLLATSRRGLVRLSVTGSEIEHLTTIDTAAREVFHTGPSPLPGGKSILFVVIPRNYGDNSRFAIAVTDPGTGAAHHRILTPGFWARYVEPGYLLVVRPDSSLVAMPFDASSRRITGNPVVLATRITVESSAFPQIAVSMSGQLVYATGRANNQRYSLARVSRDGSSVLLDSSWVKGVNSVAVSPDGSRVALVVDLGTWDVQVHDVRSGAATTISTPGAVTDNAVFTPDGRSVIFAANNAQAGVLYRASVSNPNESRAALARDSALALEGPAPSPDGRTVYYTRHRGGISDIMALALDQPGSTDRPVVAGSAREGVPSVSPNGKWLAYESDESGHYEVYVRSTDSARADRWQVSYGGGARARWSRDGHELFYIGRDSLMSAGVASDTDFMVKSRHALFSMSRFGGDYDLFPNGQFLMLARRQPTDTRVKVVFVEDWRDLLRGAAR